MHVALIGYRGSGKTTVGKRLADRLWRKFADLDELVVHKAGRSIAEIFAQDGEEKFRDLETEALREALGGHEMVLGLGGGTVIREENRRLLKSTPCRIVYLRCDPKELLRRIESDPTTAASRPALTALGGGIEEIRLKLEEREPIYRQVMDAEIDVTRMSPQDAVMYIARLL